MVFASTPSRPALSPLRGCAKHSPRPVAAVCPMSSRSSGHWRTTRGSRFPCGGGVRLTISPTPSPFLPRQPAIGSPVPSSSSTAVSGWREGRARAFDVKERPPRCPRGPFLLHSPTTPLLPCAARGAWIRRRRARIRIPVHACLEEVRALPAHRFAQLRVVDRRLGVRVLESPWHRTDDREGTRDQRRWLAGAPPVCPRLRAVGIERDPFLF